MGYTALATLAAVLASFSTPVFAQMGGGMPSSNVVPLKQPVANQVFQRDVNGFGTIPIEFDDSVKDARITSVTVTALGPNSLGPGPGFPGNTQVSSKVVDGKVVAPTGGPYAITVNLDKQRVATVSPVFVGDLWVLAGQSNMEGVGDLINVAPPHEKVLALGMDGKWVKAEEPLHWLVDSPDPVHSGDPKTRAERSAHDHKMRTKGAGLGLPFATSMVEQTGVPIGLVITAHGGTSMQQWDPAKKGEGGNSLYGSMLRSVNLAGGKVKGVLWYQGESDSTAEASKIYERVFTDFIGAVRSDLGQPDLPFYLVQIGRFVNGADPKYWNTVQDVQRRLPDRLANTAVVSVIDLELDDAIHVGTQGLKRAGRRLAKIALRELFGQTGATTPTFDRVMRGANNTLVVKFRGVNASAPQPAPIAVRPGAAGRAGFAMPSNVPGGFGGMPGGPGGPSLPVQASVGEAGGSGLRPERHIAGFSIRKEDGSPIPLIFDASVGTARDTVILKLSGPIPPGAFLWYGHGYDPYCNLTDGADMAVPVFGPIALDEFVEPKPVAAAAPAPKPEPKKENGPVKVLIITGDEYHNWKATSEALKSILSEGGKIAVDVTTTPSKDLTDANLAKYDVLLLNYKDTDKGGPETRWSDANKEAFLKAVREGKGLVAYHFASAAFTKPNWDEFEKAIGGGWRTQGFHGPAHKFTVKKTDAKHPISEGLPAKFDHVTDELYQNSKLFPGGEVLATAYSDPAKDKGTGKDEPVVWVNTYGKGRVYNNVLGHDVNALSDPNVRPWFVRGVIWAATGKVD
jgi:type 1 glutamine amidotransferase